MGGRDADGGLLPLDGSGGDGVPPSHLQGRCLLLRSDPVGDLFRLSSQARPLESRQVLPALSDLSFCSSCAVLLGLRDGVCVIAHRAPGAAGWCLVFIAHRAPGLQDGVCGIVHRAPGAAGWWRVDGGTGGLWDGGIVGLWGRGNCGRGNCGTGETGALWDSGTLGRLGCGEVEGGLIGLGERDYWTGSVDGLVARRNKLTRHASK